MKIFHSLVLLLCALFFTPGTVIAEEDSCATFDLHSDLSCTGDRVSTVKTPTWSKSGSPCIHSALQVGSSNDIWCDGDGNWHQSVYPYSDTCGKPWYLPFFMEHTFDYVVHPGECFMGTKLNSCSIGACWDAVCSWDWCLTPAAIKIGPCCCRYASHGSFEKIGDSVICQVVHFCYGCDMEFLIVHGDTILEVKM